MSPARLHSPSTSRLAGLAVCACLALAAGCGGNRGVKLQSAAGHAKCEQGARKAGAPADAARAGCDCIISQATGQGYRYENDIPGARQRRIAGDCASRARSAQAAQTNGPITPQQRADFITGCAGRRQSTAYCGCLIDRLRSNGLDTLAKISAVERKLKRRRIDPRLRAASVACRGLFRPAK
jgi:hypothetical protein